MIRSTTSIACASWLASSARMPLQLPDAPSKPDACQCSASRLRRSMPSCSSRYNSTPGSIAPQHRGRFRRAWHRSHRARGSTAWSKHLRSGRAGHVAESPPRGRETRRISDSMNLRPIPGSRQSSRLACKRVPSHRSRFFRVAAEAKPAVRRRCSCSSPPRARANPGAR